MLATSILNKITLAKAAEARRAQKIDAMWVKFGAAVRIERRTRKIPLKWFADQLGLTTAMVSYLEAGKRDWTLDRAELATRLLTRKEDWPD